MKHSEELFPHAAAMCKRRKNIHLLVGTLTSLFFMKMYSMGHIAPNMAFMGILGAVIYSISAGTNSILFYHPYCIFVNLMKNEGMNYKEFILLVKTLTKDGKTYTMFTEKDFTILAESKILSGKKTINELQLTVIGLLISKNPDVKF